MVNIFKHGSFNKNPFVKHLKEFSDYPEDMIEEIKRVSDHGSLMRILDKERKIVIEEGSIFLVNSKFSSVGFFEVPIEDFNYNSGNVIFRTEDKDSSLEYDIGILFTSKKELYKIIEGFDSLEDENDLHDLLLKFYELGIKENRLIKL